MADARPLVGRETCLIAKQLISEYLITLLFVIKQENCNKLIKKFTDSLLHRSKIKNTLKIHLNYRISDLRKHIHQIHCFSSTLDSNPNDIRQPTITDHKHEAKKTTNLVCMFGRKQEMVTFNYRKYTITSQMIGTY